MELGNLLFGKIADDCNIPFEREVNQELFYYILVNKDTGIDHDFGFDNDTFTLMPYCWDDDV